MTITRVGPLSCAKIAGLLYAAMGLLAGALISLMAAAGGFGAGEQLGPLSAIFGVGAIILLPICYGVFGFIGTLIGAVLFNIASGMTGGITIETQ